MVAIAVSENSLAQTTSTGIGISEPAFFAAAIKRCASGIKSASYSDFPTGNPAAAMKVLAIPPPTMSWSTFSERDSNTVNLVETLEPPTIAI